MVVDLVCGVRLVIIKEKASGLGKEPFIFGFIFAVAVTSHHQIRCCTLEDLGFFGEEHVQTVLPKLYSKERKKNNLIRF